MIHVDVKMFLNTAEVEKRIGAKQRKVLALTGRYSQVAMKRQIRPPKSSKKARTVVVHGRLLLVPVHGKVVDAKTLKPVSAMLAREARLAMSAKLRSEGEGAAPTWQVGPAAKKDFLRAGRPKRNSRHRAGEVSTAAEDESRQCSRAA